MLEHSEEEVEIIPPKNKIKEYEFYRDRLMRIFNFELEKERYEAIKKTFESSLNAKIDDNLNINCERIINGFCCIRCTDCKNVGLCIDCNNCRNCISCENCRNCYECKLSIRLIRCEYCEFCQDCEHCERVKGKHLGNNEFAFRANLKNVSNLFTE